MRRLMVAGNWKMNTTCSEATELASEVVAGTESLADAVDVLVCPPFPYLFPVAEVLRDSRVKLGAQNAYFEPPGAFTGEVAVEMLVDCGCRAVILGHSERRHILGETDDGICRKVQAALSGGLQVIFCVGETLSERQANQTESVLERQMSGGLEGIESLENLVIAYEPVWAIGTGQTATPDQAEAAHAFLRQWLDQSYDAATAATTRILYGGSVKPANAAELLAPSNVDGALVGGASLKGDQFLPIINSAVELAQSAN